MTITAGGQPPAPSVQVVGNIAWVDAVYPKSRHRFVGGAGVHFAQAAAKRGAAVDLVAVAGADLEWALQRLTAEGVSCEHVATHDGPSAHFELSYDERGSVERVIANHGVAERLTAHAAAQPATSHRHICCRTPLDATTVLAQTTSDFSLDFFVSSASDQVAAAARFLPLATAIFVNAVELPLLRRTIGLGELACVVATAGEDESNVYRNGTVTATTKPGAVAPVDVTGAGDTLAGCFVAAILLGDADQSALDAASAAATKSVLRVGGIEFGTPR